MSQATSLHLLSALKRAAARSGLDRTDTPRRTVSGLTAPSKAFFVAVTSQGLPTGTVLYVVPHDRDLDDAVADVRFFLAALEGLSHADVDRLVLPLPSHEVDPYRGMTPHFRVVSQRARALHAMASGTARVVIAPSAALLPRVSPPKRMRDAGIALRPGVDIAPADLADLLVDIGFTREDPADEHGEFALRGGIVDIYPAEAPLPVRLEFIGDTIESLRSYDPATQRSLAALDQLDVLPVKDEWSDERTHHVFDYLPTGSRARLLVSEPDEVFSTLAKIADQWRRSYDTLTGDDGALPEQSDEEGIEEWEALSVEDDERTEQRPVTQRARRRDRRPTAIDLPPPEELWYAPDEIRSRLEAGTAVTELDISADSPQAAHQTVRTQPGVEYRGRFAEWVADIRRHRADGGQVLFVAATPGRAERTIELLKEYDLLAAPVDHVEDVRYAAVLVATGRLSKGLALPDAGLSIVAETDVFDEDRRTNDRRSNTKAFLSDLRDLKVGDLIVHVDHGIGVFVGLKQLGVGDGQQEFLELRYAGDDKLFVPVERLDLVQKYTGANRPAVDRLGGTTWERAKSKVKKAMRDMAEELLKLYAQRKAVPGHAFAADTHWQEEFEGSFPYDLTVDQKTAVADIKRDMESSTPMDRLLCGDVGYGKTEVAMRAAFKSVMDGKQVAFLAPTTVLAFQHEKTVRERFAGFPVSVDMVSRFRSKAEQKETMARLAAGRLDIIVGTHRLLSKDVEFRDLGLLVVDEEQRFGVAHKEKIKQMRRKVDVLTMSATPIPRTLNMSLVGIRDMSTIETPPKDRLSIQTNVVKFDQQVIGRAIRHELERGGQVFFVHNRVESIFSIGDLIARIVPEARIVIGHGQMDEETLERAMLDFMARKFDILVATTIIENGLDIPNANTIIINRADRYGLSQLYQLRGRVGRSDRPAYAYLLIPPEDTLSPVAKKRLAAIKEFSDLGSGFRVAALDLEIRGAGNLLGGEQSGHIETIGFEMYMKLLEETVRELRGDDIVDDVRATVNLKVDFKIDETYIADMNQRLMLYRKVAAARRDEDIDQALEEAVDRYGPLPPAVHNLARYGRIRVAADRLGVESIDRDGRAVVIKFRAQTKVDPVQLVTLVKRRADLTLVPPSGVKLSLDRPAAGGVAPGHPAPRPSTAAPATQKLPGPGPARSGAKGLAKAPPPAPSWWTARARDSEVVAGFTKEEILKAPPDDPSATGGVFDRIDDVLSTLLAGS